MKEAPFLRSLRQRSSLAALIKSPRFWLAVALLSCLLLCFFGPLKVLLDHTFLVAHLERWGNWAVCLFVLAFALATVLGLPGVVFPIAGGAVFGLFWGTFWSVVGATLGAMGAFWVARCLLHDWAERRFGHHKALRRLKQAVAGNPLAFVVAIRLAPISPFNVVNFLFGLTPVSWVTYSAGTFFGIIPGTLAYTWLGVTGLSALQGGDRLPFFMALGFLALLCFLPVLARRERFAPRRKPAYRFPLITHYFRRRRQYEE
ncbi:MAG: TVP38/TMEM64 family protein [Oscillatoria princeps RMCB-10]|jgi:uncharacterized membrane protein YdjX (TVP38/TMEM64 family)|nr:TVP38/TMEM64 family protein [Oscillatoria princeps RMCB-10]